MLTLVENQVRLHNVTRKGNYSEKPGAIHVPLKWERLKHAIDVIRCAGKGNVENSYVCILEGWTFHPSSVENVLRLSLWREIGGPTFFFSFLSLTHFTKCCWGQISYVQWVCSTDVPRYSVIIWKAKSMCEGVPLFFLFFFLREKNNVSLWKLHMGVIFKKYLTAVSCQMLSVRMTHSSLRLSELLHIM